MIGLGRHWTAEAIDSWIRDHPPRTYAPERSLNKTVSAFVSQSFPPPTLDALPSCTFTLADFSNGTSDDLPRCPILSVTYIHVSSICIRSDYGRYCTPRLTAP